MKKVNFADFLKENRGLEEFIIRKIQQIIDIFQ